MNRSLAIACAALLCAATAPAFGLDAAGHKSDFKRDRAEKCRVEGAVELQTSNEPFQVIIDRCIEANLTPKERKEMAESETAKRRGGRSKKKGGGRLGR
ncbi:MAG: hypothetical protein IPI73_30315 [Betaproteobacteria bacterium]|nr:hypothetical protein [Betaproteobacteria bacterium]